MTARLTRLTAEILLVRADGARELGEMFLRPQEYYESPRRRFRRRVFSPAVFAAFYRRHVSATGAFTYYTDYAGYNVPGDIFLDWTVAYAGRETDAEAHLLTLLGPLPPRFYLIGARAGDAATVRHELHHALYALVPSYRARVCAALAPADLRAVYRYLRAHMYARDVLADEAAAYLLADAATLHRHRVPTAGLADVRADLWRAYAAAGGVRLERESSR